MADGAAAELRSALTRVRRRWLAARWLHGLARAATGGAVGLSGVIAVERLLAPPDVPLLAVAGAALLAVLAFGVRVLWPLRRPPSDGRVARFVEERCRELEDRVASAVAAGRPAAGFHELVVADAAERLRGIDLARVVPPARLRRGAARGLLALAALGAVVAVGSTPLARVARTAWLHASPAGAELAVDPGDVRLVAGQPLRVRARFAGGSNGRARTPPTLSVLDGAAPREIRMHRAGDAYVAEFPSVTRSFRYRVGAAAFTSADYRVEALSPPRVTRIDVEYTYPSFTGRRPRVEEDGGDLFAPAGTVARLVVHTDEPVAEGALVLSGGRRIALADAGGGRRAATVVVEGNDRYRVRVVDADGLSNRDAADYLIRAAADRPPTVRVLRPGGDREITPLEEVAVEVRAEDDHVVDRLDLVYTVVGRAERVLPFDVPARASAATGVRTLFVEDLGVEPGDVITYYARARDAGRGGATAEARSDLYFLEIRPFDNAFEEALSQGGGGPQGAEIGRLAALQKQIIVATWRLDRQGEGSSADDVRAVAEVQGDVRDTTVRAAGRPSGRTRRGRAGGGPADRGRALRAAVEAMTEAEAALATLDPAAAMPHETAALNHLLSAQAAVRRRQVSMQRGGGAAGQAAQLDLSALFDRELRREQETSFETGRPPGEPAEDEDDPALDRLRELARRQARINRDLRRPPETGTEAARRRLERLRREQQALRTELEALAERLGRRPGAGDGSGPVRAARETLDRVAEQMRRAAGDLRREDAGAAREHGDRAVGALRRLAESLRGAGRGERAGVLGELQLEAQQLAEAQRRLAGEMASAAAGDVGSGYRERLAGEKDDLADRADALEAGLSSLGGGADAAAEPASTASAADPSVAEAHRTLVRERVAARMRAAADRLRAAGPRPAGEAARTDGRTAGETARAAGPSRAGEAAPADGRRAGESVRAAGPRPGTEAASTAGGPAEETALGDVLGAVAGLLRRAMMQDEAQRRLTAELETARRLRARLEGTPPGAGGGGPAGDASSREAGSASPRPEADGGVRGGRADVEPGTPPAASPAGAEADPAGGGEGSRARRGDRADRRGDDGAGGSGQEAAAELARHSGLLRALGEASPGLAADLERWAQQWRSRSAPGIDPARLDFAHWTSLRRDLVTALQRFERGRMRELADRALRDRYAAEPTEAMPARYRRLVDEYYRSLADAPRAVP